MAGPKMNVMSGMSLRLTESAGLFTRVRLVRNGVLRLRLRRDYSLSLVIPIGGPTK